MSKPGKKQKMIFAAFALVLLALPLYFILRSEDLLKDKAHTYRFRPERLRDPHDPLRGNYLVINFPSSVPWEGGPAGQPVNGEVYVRVERDSLGYAHFAMASAGKPATDNFFTAKAHGGQEGFVWIEVPFNRYFINESNALLAEKVYWRELRDTATNMFMEVCIRDGEALLKDVYVDSIPLSRYMNALSPRQRQELETQHR